MLRLPKFAIKSRTKDGAFFTALFKPTGDPKTLKVILVYKRAKSVVKIPAPQGEVLSWGGIASLAFADGFPSNNQEGENAKPTVAAAPLHEQKPPEGSGGNKETKPSNRVLPKLRSNPAKGKRPSPATVADELQSPLVLVKDALSTELYTTAVSPDPKKHYLCRYEGRHKDKFVLQVYFPAPLAEWSRVEVDADYKLRLHSQTATPKERTMKPVKNGATALAEPPTNAPQATSKKGLTVYEAWGKAFEAHATKKDAPEQIVKFMEENFPGRKTKWAKWVNPVRARYNAGKLPGAAKPKEKIAVYKFTTHSDAPARTGKERREKKERRTPPLKSVRAKAVKAAEAGPKNISKAFKLPKK